MKTYRIVNGLIFEEVNRKVNVMTFNEWLNTLTHETWWAAVKNNNEL